jgi:uncharacterized protein (DUF362 family)
MLKEVSVMISETNRQANPGKINDDEQAVALVDVSQCDGIREAIEQALKLIHFDFSRKFEKVAIKPNLCYYWKHTTGETTDPALVGALIDVLQAHRFADKIFVVESDASAMRMNHVVKMLGYEKLAKEKDVQLFNLSKDAQIPLDGNSALAKDITIPKLLTEIDFLISVPKLKGVHNLTGITCALKNQFGCIGVQRKIAFHEHIDEAIALVNKAVTPNLVMVDGIVSLGKTPRKLNLLMASNDPVATDVVAAKIAGLNPRKVKHIVESENMGVGSTNVKLVGDDLSRFVNIFPRRGFIYNLARQNLVSFYGFYVSHFTVEGRTLKLKPAWWDF